MLKPLGLRFHNNSGSVAENVGFVGILEAGRRTGFNLPCHQDDLPWYMGNHLPTDKDIKVGMSSGGIEINVEIDRIRPKEYVWAGRGVQFRTKETGTLIWKGRFVADNLPEATECVLPLQTEYEEREIQREDLESAFKP